MRNRETTNLETIVLKNTTNRAQSSLLRNKKCSGKAWKKEPKNPASSDPYAKLVRKMKAVGGISRR